MHEREKLRQRGFLFGHYDSRGGATFMPTTSFHEAMTGYMAIWGYERTPEVSEAERWDQMFADLLDEYEVVVFDEDPREDTELDKDYGGRFSIRRLDKFWWDPTKCRWRLHEAKLLLLHTGAKPRAWEEERGLKYMFVPRGPANLGEDAWGLAWGTGL